MRAWQPNHWPHLPSPVLQFGRSINDNMQLVTRATSLRVGGVTIVVRLALSTASQQWEVTAALNGKVINGSSAMLAGGITVRVAKFNPPSHQVSSRVTINAGEKVERGACGPDVCLSVAKGPCWGWV